MIGPGEWTVHNTRQASARLHRIQMQELVFQRGIYLEEGEQLVPIDDQLKPLVVNQGKKARIAQLIGGYIQFLQGHSPAAPACSCRRHAGSFRHALLYFRVRFPLIFNVTDQVGILGLKLKDVVMLGSYQQWYF